MDSRRSFRRADSRRRPDRRQFLAALGAGASIGLAGCSSSGDGGDGTDGSGGDGGSGDGGSGDGDVDTDGSSGDSDTDDSDSSGGDASDLACMDLTAGYTAYSGGDGALFAGFEIPTVLADEAEIMPVSNQVWMRAVRPLTADGDAQFHLSVMQSNDGKESARDLLPNEEAVTEIEFSGETLTASKLTGTEHSGVEQLRVPLPYDGGDGTRYYPFTVQLEVENAPGGEVSEACDAAIDEAARHVMESLHPDPATTFGESTSGALARGHGR